MGRIARAPRLLCVQQETCAPMVRAWDAGSDAILPEHVVRRPAGIAKAILRGDPSGAYPHVRRVVLESGGTFTAVGEEAIREARRMVEELEGLHPCFSAATAVAGLVKLARAEAIDRNAVVLVNLTGKDRDGDDGPGTAHRLLRSGDGWVPQDPAEASVRSLRFQA